MRKKPNGKPDTQATPDPGKELGRLLQAEVLRSQERNQASSHYIPEASEDGKSERVQLRLPPIMIRAMGVLMQSGKLPYLTQADLMRSAIYLHLTYLFEAAEVPVTPMTAVKLMVEAAQEMRIKKEMERAVLTLRQAAQQLIDAGDMDEAKAQLAKLWSKISQFPDSAWKRRLEVQVKGLYSQVQGSSNGASTFNTKEWN